jgi:hypothetical protein
MVMRTIIKHGYAPKLHPVSRRAQGAMSLRYEDVSLAEEVPDTTTMEGTEP